MHNILLGAVQWGRGVEFYLLDQLPYSIGFLSEGRSSVDDPDLVRGLAGR